MPRLAGWEVGRVPGFYKGAGVPSASTLEAGDYIVGDYYVNTSATTLYICSTAGSASTSVWTQVGGGAAGVTATVWAKIATIDVAGAAVASVTFSGLTGDTDLEYEIRGITFGVAATDTFYARFNNDATAANYPQEQINFHDATAGPGFTTDVGAIIGVARPVGCHIYMQINAKSGQDRTFYSHMGSENSGSNNNFFISSGRWTAAGQITSIVLITTGGSNIGIGSHYELWSPRAVHVTSIP